MTEEVLDASAIRAQHQALLLRRVWRAQTISRIDLARETGLSRSTVSVIIGDLLRTGLVHETGAGDSRGGRRPVMLGFRDDARLLVGVELGATHVSVAITNLRTTVHWFGEEPFPVRRDPQGTLQLTKGMIQRGLNHLGVALEEVVGIGVAVPSPIDPAAPDRLPQLIMPDWEGYDLLAELRRVFPVPVLVDNDANLGALAEQWWGVGRDGADMAYLKVATGVGAGLVINGRIARGFTGAAGEIGHTSIDPTGPMCICGRSGCLNVMVGGEALVRDTKSRLAAHPTSMLHARPVTIEALIQASAARDPLAREVMRRAGESLGLAIANLVNLLNPKRVVLGGGVLRVQHHLLDPIRESVARHSLRTSAQVSEILSSGLDEKGIAIGAATLVLEAALADQTMLISRRSKVAGE
jgi:predicted NBD/HSP70 family sugar kinase